jgi:hypothetical protein
MLKWFDLHSYAYGGVAWSAFVVLVALACAPLRSGPPRTKFARWCHADLLFEFWLMVALLAFRWPFLVYRYELNVDECQLIAGAQTLIKQPVYWFSVNGATSGPLNFIPLLVARAAQLPFGYFAARLAGLALVVVAVVAVFRTLRCLYGDLARIGALPLWAFFAFVLEADYLHYSGEHLPVALLAFGLWHCTATWLRSPSPNTISWRNLVGAMAIGAAPLAKLQSAPVATVALGGLALLALNPPVPGPRQWRRLAEIAIGATVPTLAIAAYTAAAGVARDAWTCYILQNLAYTAHADASRAKSILSFWTFTEENGAIHPFLLGICIFTCLALLLFRRFRERDRHLTLLWLAITAAAWVAAVTPGRTFGHYLLFLVVPASLLAGTLLGSWRFAEPAVRPPRRLALVAFAGLCLLLQVLPRLTQRLPTQGNIQALASLPNSRVATAIARYAHAGEYLGQWGWVPRLHVETQMPHATRDCNSSLQITDEPLGEYFRTNYLADLIRNDPPVFVDTVGPKNFYFQDRALAHECFPQLAEFIRSRYTLVADLDSTRIYVRNDRLASQPPAASASPHSP